MDVHDEFIPASTFAECAARLPEVCVEVVLETDEGVLVARRTNEPAKGEWFWPGSRLYKGEELDDAVRRVAREELGIEIDLLGRLGVYAHFWETSALPGVESRHTVNVVYRAAPASDSGAIALDDQHDDYRFLTEVEPGLHEYVRRYVEENGLLD